MFMEIGIGKERSLKLLQIKKYYFSVSFLFHPPAPTTTPYLAQEIFLAIVLHSSDQFVRFRARNIIVSQVLDLIKSIKKRIPVAEDMAGSGCHPMSRLHPMVKCSPLVPWRESSSLGLVGLLSGRGGGAEANKVQQPHRGNLALCP